MATEKSSLEIEVKAKGVAKTKKEIENLSKSTDKLKTNQDKATQSTKALSTALDKQKKASGGALNSQERMNRSAGNMGQKAGLAAIQVEQLVGQIAGGQNPMRAFGQQSADIGFVLGKPLVGAILGVSAALISLLPKLLNTGKTIEQLTQLSAELDSTFTSSANGLAIYSDTFLRLQKQLEGTAELQQAVNIQTAKDIKTDGLKRLTKLTKGYNHELEMLFTGNEKIDKQYKEQGLRIQANNIERVARRAKVSKEAMAEFGVELRKVLETGEGFDRLAGILGEMQGGADNLNKTSKGFNKFAKKMLELLPELEKSQRILNETNLEGRTVAEKLFESQQKAGQQALDTLEQRIALETGGMAKINAENQKYGAILAGNIRFRAKQLEQIIATNKAIEDRRKAEEQSLKSGEEIIRQLGLKIKAIKEGQKAADMADTSVHESQRTTIANLKEQLRVAKETQKQENKAKKEQEKTNETNKKIVQQIINDSMSATDKIIAEQNKREQAARELYRQEKISFDELQSFLVTNTTNTNAKLAQLAKDKADKEAKAVADAEKKAARIRENTKNLLQQYMPNTVLLKEKYEAELEVLKEALAKERITFEEHNRAKAVADATYEETKTKLENENHIKSLDANQLYWATWLSQAELTMTTFNDVTREGIEGLQTGLGGAFEQLIMDGEGIKSVVAGIFENMARAQLAALGQMAAERLTHFLVGKALEKSAAATGAAAMVANATASQSMAALNAYMSTAAIPVVGPLLAPEAALAAMTATAPFVAAVAGSSGAGAAARALGGQVRGGESYLVGERGPEMLTMPSNRMGSITPNSSMGGGQLNVTVENYGSSNISVQKISETDVRIIAREVATQTVQREAPRVIASDISNPNGRVSKTLANNTNTQRRR